MTKLTSPRAMMTAMRRNERNPGIVIHPTGRSPRPYRPTSYFSLLPPHPQPSHPYSSPLTAIPHQQPPELMAGTASKRIDNLRALQTASLAHSAQNPLCFLCICAHAPASMKEYGSQETLQEPYSSVVTGTFFRVRQLCPWRRLTSACDDRASPGARPLFRHLTSA
jgi:hypothetical protein